MKKLSAEEFVDQLLSPEVLGTPSDSKDPSKVELELPPWYDEDKFNRGRIVYNRNRLVMGINLIFGLVSVYAVPTILSVLASTHKSSSPYTAYARYLNTYLYIMTWFEYELKPGSISWKSLQRVRRGHIIASRSEKLKGSGIVSQRDMSMTIFGMVGNVILKPDFYGVRALKKTDWEDLIYGYKVIGYMLGLQERYNIARDSYEETYAICELINERVYRPALENPPEPFENMCRTFLKGVWSMLPVIDTEAAFFFSKYVAGVPGYIYTEKERIDLCTELRKHLKGKPDETGVPVTVFLTDKCVEKLPKMPPRMLYLKDYEVLDETPSYAYLRANEKFKLHLYILALHLHSYSFFRILLNMFYDFIVFLWKYFPIFAFFRFGFKKSYIDLYRDTPVTSDENKPNSYYKKNREPETWYQAIKSFIW